ncbi:MAG: hypothetical protein K0S32_672 [Bacteroidetes bacterium]|jgi:uncharacterized RDD family membrane protein YckC|nr:hypothetical protein [Bacteroidota bacterium]
MKKITEISITRYRTSTQKDSNGIRKKVPYKAYRNVVVVGHGRRFAHFFVDLMAYQVIYQFLLFVYALIANTASMNSFDAILGQFVISQFFFFSFPVYYILFEHFLQRTPGKFLTGCRVIDVYGNKPEIGTNILRNIIRLVPFEFFSCAFSDRGWHDRWSDTYVVQNEEFQKLQELLNKEEEKTSSNEFA